MIALLFPGQGADARPLARELAARVDTRALFDVASRETGVDVPRALRRDEPVLDRSDVRQALVVASSLTAFRELGLTGLMAGHSLGELSAWAAAGAMSHEDAVVLAARRGRLMAQAANDFSGDLVALRAGHAERDAALALENVALAAYNAPDEWVFAAPNEMLEALVALGGRRLNVGGPWHHPHMRCLCTELNDELETIDFAPAQIVSSQPQLRDDPRASLLEQLDQPVQWVAVQRELMRRRTKTFVTVGPGKILRALLRRTLGTVTIHTSEHLDDMRRTRTHLGVDSAREGMTP